MPGRRSMLWGALLAGVVLAVLGRRGLDVRASEESVAQGRTEPDFWQSRDGCLAALAAKPARPRLPGRVRLGTWNVRWFPDGRPGSAPSPDARGPQATDVEWLACAIAALDVDVLALQEIKGTPRADAALERLLRRLDALTGGRHRVERDRCKGEGRQHVALLFDEKRVRGESFRHLASLNPRGAGDCDQQLRPGLAGYFRARGGADFHLVSVHLDSGPKRRDLESRERALAGVEAAHRELQAAVPDDDLVFAGDFNTMGCASCSPRLPAAAELAALDARIAGQAAPLRRLPVEPPCSEYYRGSAGLLDHFLVARAMREVAADASSRVFGFCARSACRRIGSAMPAAYDKLSDHCPVVLEFADRDDDP